MPLVAFMVFFGELGFPTIVPTEVALLLLGAYAVASLPGLLVALVVVTVGDTAGTFVLYLVTLTGGRRLLARLLRRHMGHANATVLQWRQRIGDHDAWLILCGRSIPLVRVYVPIGAGLVGIRPRTYLTGAVPGAVVWAGTPLVAGYLFRRDVHHIIATYTAVTQWLTLLLPGFAALAAAGWWVYRGTTQLGRLRRGRAVAGTAAVLGIGAYLIAMIGASDRAADLGLATMPLAAVAGWLLLIGGLGLALLGMVVADVRAIMSHARQPEHSIRSELMSTARWIGIVSTAVIAMIALEIFFPSL